MSINASLQNLMLPSIQCILGEKIVIRLFPMYPWKKRMILFSMYPWKKTNDTISNVSLEKNYWYYLHASLENTSNDSIKDVWNWIRFLPLKFEVDTYNICGVAHKMIKWYFNLVLWVSQVKIVTAYWISRVITK